MRAPRMRRDDGPAAVSGRAQGSDPLARAPVLTTVPCSASHVSFVDCPGHDILMATMLTGAAVMDAALLLVAGNESCPQPQTSEHLAAVEIMKLRNILILQNKVDLVREAEALEQQKDIAKFIEGEGIPSCAKQGPALTRDSCLPCQPRLPRTPPSSPSLPS